MYGASLSLVDFWAVTFIIFLPPTAKGPRNCLLLPHRPCGLFPLGVSQLAKMLLPLAESLIMVLETPTWLFPALVSASKWCVWDLCHNHFPNHFPLIFSFENHHAGDSLKSHTSTYEEGKRRKSSWCLSLCQELCLCEKCTVKIVRILRLRAFVCVCVHMCRITSLLSSNITQ